MNDFDPAVAAQLAPRWDAQRMAGNLAQIEHRLERTRVSRKWAIAVAALATSVAIIGMVFVFWPTRKPGFFSTTRTRPVAAVSSHAPATETHFRDGSTATALTEGAVLELRTTSDTEMVVVAKSGAFRFDVVPNPVRQFVVEVGTVTVRVLGTRFVVAQQDHRVEVRVERGRVGVSWSDGRTELGAEESGWFPPLPETLQAAPPEPGSEPASSVARGPEYLMMAADAARLSNHPQQAVGYLQRVTKEYPGDSRAPLAAFTLGRIYMSQLGQPVAAAKAFALVRQLAPAGALVEDALAREAEALEQAGQHAAAQQLVQAYLKQYPTGRRSERLRQLVH